MAKSTVELAAITKMYELVILGCQHVTRFPRSHKALNGVGAILFGSQTAAGEVLTPKALHSKAQGQRSGDSRAAPPWVTEQSKKLRRRR